MKMYDGESKTIAVDFDGTLCKVAFPNIGKPIKKNIRKVKREKRKGTLLILWTCREGKNLEDALKWCSEQGIKFDRINTNIQEHIDKYGSDCRKVFAHEYWDDKAKRVR